MVRRHGWAGSPPADEDEARARIIEAAIRCVDRQGPAQTTLSDVATELGVTRPTVYRYYPGTDELFTAVARADVQSFLDELTEHLAGVTGPQDWVVEGLASAIERVPTKPYLTLLLESGRSEPFARGVTSTEAVELGRQLFERSSVDWLGEGFDERERDELIEVMLRVLQSMVMDPPDPPREAAALRAFLRRWIGPAIAPVG